MNIGFIATRLAGVDGVSLETAKLVTVLERMGHTCFYCAGELDDGGPPGDLIPEMHFKDPTAQRLHDIAFSTPTPSRDLFRDLYAQADMLRGRLEGFVDEYHIDLLISQNASTIPMNISLGIAIRDLVERRRIPLICHNHDFYFERERFMTNGIGDILETAFPPNSGPTRHFVINTIMQHQLYVRRGISATYLPNVFDYANPPAPPDDFAMGFRAAFDIRDDDLILLQPTRIIRRKGIEKAIELVRKLEDERIVLVVTGYEGDEPGDYGGWLREEADRAGIRARFIGDQVGEGRGQTGDKPVFSLWDIYPHADLVTYPSTYEGFGNAFLEALYFRKPVVVHTYSVYKSDIAPVGIKAVEFNYDITPDVLKQTRHLLDSADARTEMTEHNYEVALSHFSYAVLESRLAGMLATF